MHQFSSNIFKNELKYFQKPHLCTFPLPPTLNILLQNHLQLIILSNMLVIFISLKLSFQNVFFFLLFWNRVKKSSCMAWIETSTRNGDFSKSFLTKTVEIMRAQKKEGKWHRKEFLELKCHTKEDMEKEKKEEARWETEKPVVPSPRRKLYDEVQWKLVFCWVFFPMYFFFCVTVALKQQTVALWTGGDKNLRSFNEFITEKLKTPRAWSRRRRMDRLWTTHREREVK